MNYQSSSMSLNKLTIDRVKKDDLKQIFQILMILPANRTIADLNTLVKIILNVPNQPTIAQIQPIKEIKNLSAIYHCCKYMYLAKFKEKNFIYQKRQESQSLYIVLTGKIGLYKRTNQQYESDEAIFLEEGSCFGKLFEWRIKFLPLALEETLMAILPRRQFNKIGIVVNAEKELILKEIKNAGIIPSNISEQKIASISSNFVINRVPHGHYLIKKGQTPKVIFLILKGMVKKIIQIPKQDNHKSARLQTSLLSLQKQESYSAMHYSTGDYFPKANMNSPVNYSLITECPSQIVTLPKKILKSIGFQFSLDATRIDKDTAFYRGQLQKQKEWLTFKQCILNGVMTEKQNKLRH